MVYAFDADTNGGINANPLWQAALLTNSTPAGTLANIYGVVGTPVIDLPSQTMYLVSSESKAGTYIFRLHALNITTGAEKLGGPVTIQDRWQAPAAEAAPVLWRSIRSSNYSGRGCFS
jgi:hypothetical protein